MWRTAQEVREGRSGLSSVGHFEQFPWATFRFFEQLAAGPRSSISVRVWSGTQKPLQMFFQQELESITCVGRAGRVKGQGSSPHTECVPGFLWAQR